MLNPSLVTIVSNISQCGTWKLTNFLGKVAGESAVKLWYWLRAIDTRGSGKAYLSIETACKFFNRSKRQIKRYLADGVRLGFFRATYAIRADVILVYYTSTIKVALALGLRNLGAIAQVPIQEINNLKRTATKIAVLANQRASEYCQKSKKLAGTIIDPADALKPSGIASGGILFRTRRYLIVKASAQLVGGSQKTAAKKLGRSQTTVCSHLADLSPINKLQIAVADRRNWMDWNRNVLDHKPQLGLFKLEDFPFPLKVHTSIYRFPEIELVPQKYLRAKFNALAKIKRRNKHGIGKKHNRIALYA